MMVLLPNVELFLKLLANLGNKMEINLYNYVEPESCPELARSSSNRSANA